MIRLLKTGFRRCFINPVFAIALILSIIIPIWNYGDYYNCIAYECIIMAVVVAWNMGNEYSSGGYGNKLICGYGRIKIFLSEMILGIITALILFWIYMAGTLCESRIYFETIYISNLIRIVVAMMVVVISIATMMVVLNSIVAKRSLGIVLSIVFVYLLLIIPQYIDSYKFKVEDENYRNMIEAGQEIFPTAHLEKCSNVYYFYVNSVEYYRYKLAVNIGMLEELKTEWELKQGEIEALNVAVIYSVMASCVMTAAGCLCFKKKNIL